jgi:hypothetical protein
MGSGNRTNHGVVFKPHNAFAVRFGSGIMDQEGFSRRREYIAKNLVKERLGAACDELRYCFTRHDFRRAGQRIERLGFKPLDQEGFSRCREYIAKNPVKEGFAAACDKFRYCFAYLARQKAAGAKALDSSGYSRHD